MAHELAKSIIQYLQDHDLKLITAESCTAGQILALLGKHEGCGECVEFGYVVYSENAKKSLLGVKQKTIDKHTLTSEAVALEMVKGILKKQKSGMIGVATTGLTGLDSMDGVPPGTICIAWGMKIKGKNKLKAKTVHLKGSRKNLQLRAAKIALKGIITFNDGIKDSNQKIQKKDGK